MHYGKTKGKKALVPNDEIRTSSGSRLIMIMITIANMNHCYVLRTVSSAFYVLARLVLSTIL